MQVHLFFCSGNDWLLKCSQLFSVKLNMTLHEEFSIAFFSLFSFQLVLNRIAMEPGGSRCANNDMSLWWNENFSENSRLSSRQRCEAASASHGRLNNELIFPSIQALPEAFEVISFLLNASGLGVVREVECDHQQFINRRGSRMLS